MPAADPDGLQRERASAPARSLTPTDAPKAGSATTDATRDRLPLDSVTDLANQRFRPELREEIAEVQPSQEWASEGFSEAASSQLKKLAAWLSDGGSVREALGDLCDDAGRAAPLLPETTRIWQDDTGELRRWRPASSPSTSTTDMPLTEMLLTLRAATRQPRWEFKITDVSLADQGATTRVHGECLEAVEGARTERTVEWLCHWTLRKDAPPQLSRIEVTALEEVRVDGSRQRFLDASRQVFADADLFQRQILPGVDYWRRRMDWRFGMDVVGAHGLAVGDANGDGREDVYLCEPGGLPNRLLLQQPDGTVRDESSAAGVDFLEPTHSGLFVDFDNDGDQDLAIASGRYLLLLENDGQARFQRRQIHELESVIRSMAAADYDRDRRVDLYLCGYFLRDGSRDGVGLGRPMPYHDANNGAPNFLFRNTGDWRFEDVTKAVGLDENNSRFSYACAWTDYDNDGDQDLYVANDFGRNNLYRNLGGRFDDVAAEAGVEDISAGMSASWGDFDRDGWLDLYVGNMYSSAGNRVSYQRQYLPGADAQQRAIHQRHARGNTLFRNTLADGVTEDTVDSPAEGAADHRQGSFRDVSLEAGVNMARWAWSSNFIDLNNDGWEDLVVANGMVTGQDDPGDL